MSSGSRKKCLHSELFCFVFSCIWTEYGELRNLSPYSAQMRENADQNNSEYGYFSRSQCHCNYHQMISNFFSNFQSNDYLVHISAKNWSLANSVIINWNSLPIFDEIYEMKAFSAKWMSFLALRSVLLLHLWDFKRVIIF